MANYCAGALAVPFNADFRGRKNNQTSDGCQGQW